MHAVCAVLGLLLVYIVAQPLCINEQLLSDLEDCGERDPPTPEFFCINGIWVVYNYTVVSDQVLDLSGCNVRVAGNLTLEEGATVKISVDSYINITEWLVLIGEQHTLEYTMTIEEMNAYFAQTKYPIMEYRNTTVSDFSQYTTMLVFKGPAEKVVSGCREWDGSGRYFVEAPENPVFEGEREGITLQVGISELYCNLWWIILFSIVLAGAITLVIIIMSFSLIKGQ